jgi:hypothetical protein
MNAALQDALRARPIAGVIACAERQEGQTLWFELFDRAITPPQFAQALPRLVTAAEGFAQHGLPCRRLCWSFEHLKAFTSHREDGAVLVLLAKQDRSTAWEEIEQWLEEYLLLAPEAPPEGSDDSGQ